MLNIKKGLALVLAAATAFTFAPVSAFAGTSISIAKSVSGKEPLLATMNETANVWSYATNDTTSPAAYSLNDEQDACVVLTPSDPDGSVTFTENVTTKDSTVLENGQWFKDNGSGSLAKDTTNKEANSVLQLTSAKNSKTLKITASVAKLRALGNTPKAYTIKTSTVTDADLATNLQVTVILVNHDVKMNNLKVTLSNGGDSALNRYKNGSSDEFNAFEARPNGTVTGADFEVTTSVDTAAPIKTRKPISQVVLNLATGETTKTFEVESNADVKYKSDDENVATIDKDGIHAKGVGETYVYVRTKQSLTAYGEVEVKIPVKVINKPKATLSAPEELYVHGYGKANAATIGANGTNIQKYSIRYRFVYWNPLTQTFETYASDHDKPVAYSYYKLNPYKLDESKDTVYVLDYTGDDNDLYNWNSYLEVSATGADGYADPDSILVKLRFVQNERLFALDSTEQNLHVGESVQITTKSVTAVSGAAFSYKSINPAVATVSNTGVIKAVSEGSTQVAVSYGGDTQYVNVNVTNYENGNGSTETPAKVTGVKVSNKKGAKVTVKFNKVTTAPTMKYYVQKKVSGKTAGKSVGSAKTTLSVKKGATVKVRVKAYYYDVNGDKHVGAYSAWKTLKTDKK